MLKCFKRKILRASPSVRAFVFKTRNTKRIVISVLCNRIFFETSTTSRENKQEQRTRISGAIRAILDDADIRVMLGCEEFRGKLQTFGYTGAYFSPHDALPESCAVPAVQAQTPCYMVYTSGSTGKPKGVLKSHGAVIDFLQAYCRLFDFKTEDSFGNQTPLFFDASAKDIYVALKVGATIEILPTELFAMPTMLIEYLNARKVTVISWVPTALSIVAPLRTF